jgi:cyclomaltodextrinase
VTADPSLFVFGPHATPEHLAETARANLSGVWHGARIHPYAPVPNTPVRLHIDVGANLAVSRVSVRCDSEGSAPGPDAPVFEATHRGTRWDDLAWRYVDEWVAELPGKPDGTRVRYAIQGHSAMTGASYDADSSAYQGTPTLFGYTVRDAKPPAWLDDAVIYQIFVDRFYRHGDAFDRPLTAPDEVYGGDLQGVREKLPYLVDLGINAIWLTPIVEAETYHRYDAVDFRTVAANLGGPDALHRLVDDAHRQGIRILLDLALNHASWRNPYFLDARQNAASRYRSWFRFTDWPDGYESFFGVSHLPELNTDLPEVVDYLMETAAWYLREFDVDGFRLDYALGPSLLFWSEFSTRTKAVKLDAYTVGEVTASPAELARFQGRLDGCLDFPELQAFRQYFVHRSIDSAAFHAFLERNDAFYDAHFSHPSFLDNHDMNRFLWAAKGDKQLLKLAATCQFSLRQPPIIYYGSEVGLSQTGDVSACGFDASRLPMFWGDARDTDLLEFYRRLIRGRREYSALRSGRRTPLVAEGNVYAYRCHGEDGDVVVALNGSDGEVIVDVGGAGRDLITGEEVSGPTSLDPLSGIMVPVA